MDITERDLLTALRKAASGKITEVGFFVGEGKEAGYRPLALIRQDRTVLMVRQTRETPTPPAT